MPRLPFSALALTASLWMLSSCAPTSAPLPDLKAEEAAIRTADEQWASAAGKNDVDATVAFYSSDAVLLAPNAPIANTPKAIRDSWAGMLGPNTTISWKPTRIEVAKSGDLGFLYGTYQLTIKDPKSPVNDQGKMVEIWKKQADGKWKCIVDTFNSDLPLPAPAAPEKKK